MWSDWLFACDCGFSLSALWWPLSAPTILLGFLLPWTWGISSRLFHQSTAAAPYLGRVAPPDLERGVVPLGSPAPVQLPLLGHGVATSAKPIAECQTSFVGIWQGKVSKLEVCSPSPGLSVSQWPARRVPWKKNAIHTSLSENFWSVHELCPIKV